MKDKHTLKASSSTLIKIIITCLTSILYFCLLIGCETQEIYHGNNITANIERSDNRLDLSVDFEVPTSTLPDNTMQTLLTFAPVTEYEITMSDGMIYNYNSDGVLDDGGTIYMKTYSSLSEIEKDLNLDIISSSEIIYPENENNFVLEYFPDSYIFINSASSKTKEGDASDIRFHINLKGINNKYGDTIADISENIRHEELKTKAGNRVDVFIDETKSKAGIYLLSTGYLYSWKLNNIQTFDDVKNFVNSLE